MIRFTCKALLVSFIAILICVFIMLFYRSEVKKSRNNNWIKQTKSIEFVRLFCYILFNEGSENDVKRRVD